MYVFWGYAQIGKEKERKWLGYQTPVVEIYIVNVQIIYLFIYFGDCSMFFFFLYVYLCIVFISIRAGFFFFVCFFRCELNTCCQTFYCFLDYICSARLARTAEELQTSTRPASCSPQNSRTLHCSAFLSRSSFHHLSK